MRELRRALVISTTSPIPDIAGNRGRVSQIIEFLRNEGYKISLLLYPFDAEWQTGIPGSYDEIKNLFEYFLLVPVTMRMELFPIGGHQSIDAWWDVSIGKHISWLTERVPFDVAICNYTFMSKSLEYVPPRTIKILDTHDILSDRHKILMQAGIKPDFFNTSIEQEAIGLNRADLILAIKDSDATKLRKTTSVPVATIPFWRGELCSIDRSINFPSTSANRQLKVGFIGSTNTVNVHAARITIQILISLLSIHECELELHICGSVCKYLFDVPAWVTLLGEVTDIKDFYNNIDVAIVPFSKSTGAKIKAAEALRFGVPIISTSDGFDGYEPRHPTQDLQSVEALCLSLVEIVKGSISLAELQEATKEAAFYAHMNAKNASQKLAGYLRKNSKEVVIVYEMDKDCKSNLIGEFIRQFSATIRNFARVSEIKIGGPLPAQSQNSNDFAPIQGSEEGNSDFEDAATEGVEPERVVLDLCTLSRSYRPGNSLSALSDIMIRIDHDNDHLECPSLILRRGGSEADQHAVPLFHKFPGNTQLSESHPTTVLLIRDLRSSSHSSARILGEILRPAGIAIDFFTLSDCGARDVDLYNILINKIYYKTILLFPKANFTTSLVLSLLMVKGVPALLIETEQENIDFEKKNDYNIQKLLLKYLQSKPNEWRDKRVKRVFRTDGLGSFLFPTPQSS